MRISRTYEIQNIFPTGLVNFFFWVSMPENAFQKEKKKKKEELRHQNQEVKQAYHRKQVTYIIIYTTYDVLLIVFLFHLLYICYIILNKPKYI